MPGWFVHGLGGWLPFIALCAVLVLCALIGIWGSEDLDDH